MSRGVIRCLIWRALAAACPAQGQPPIHARCMLPNSTPVCLAPPTPLAWLGGPSEDFSRRQSRECAKESARARPGARAAASPYYVRVACPSSCDTNHGPITSPAKPLPSHPHPACPIPIHLVPLLDDAHLASVSFRPACL